MDLKVLMVSPYFPPVINGVSIHVYYLVKGLTDNGIHVRLHTIRPSTTVDVSRNHMHLDNLDIVRFNRLIDFTGSSNQQPISLSYIRSTVNACDEFDMVHIHDFPKVCNEALILIMKKLKKRKPLILSPHAMGSPSLAHKRAGLRAKVYWSLGMPRRVFKSADKIITVSSLQRELFVQAYGARKVCLIPEGIPDHYFVDKPFFTDGEKLKLLFIGRLIEEKGIRDLLCAIHEIVKTGKDQRRVELVCIGPDCGYSRVISGIINNLGLNDLVKILGPLSERRKIEYLDWCDVLVLPSYFEAFGIPIVEAMARGKPVIATATVGSRSLVKNGETGFLVQIGNSHSIAIALLRFLRNPELRYQIGRNALEHASEYHIENMIKGHVRLYENLL